MGTWTSWFQGYLCLDPARVVDTHVFDVPLSRKTPDLTHPTSGAPAAAEAMEEVKFSDLIEDMDRAQVAASLVTLHEDTDEFLRCATRHTGRLFGLAYYDSFSTRRGLERVQALCHDHPDLILGVTTAMPGLDHDPRLRDFAPLYEFCAKRGLPIQFHQGNESDEAAPRPMALAVLARQYPRLKIVCQDREGWGRETLALLNRFPNTFLQVDGRSLRPRLHTTGSRKVMFRSDWRGRETGYFERVQAVRRLPWWQRQHVGWRTAVHVYGPRILSPSTRFDSQPSPR